MELSKWVADRLPKKVVYFVGIRLWVNATSGQYSEHDANEMTVDDALTRWKDTHQGSD